jgi:aminoglycoside phosphotransferase (APT) family kinase protein
MAIKHFTPQDDFAGIMRENLDGIINTEQIPTGWTNFVFRAHTKHETYIFRFPRNDFFAEAMSREIPFTKWLARRVRTKSTRQHYLHHNGRGFSMHRSIKGHVLTEVIDKLSVDQKIRLARDIEKYLTHLQSLTHKIPFKLEPLSGFLRDLASVNNQNYDFTKLDPLIELENEKPVLVHGDFNPGNIILDKKMRLLAVIDYAFAMRYSSIINDKSRIIGRLPSNYRQYFSNHTDPNIDRLIAVWQYVERDYCDYIRRECPDIILPDCPD